MFDTFNGLPLHALVIHGAVVLIPLSGLLGVLFAVPRTRSWARWPLPVVSILALGAAFVPTRSGEALQRVRGYEGVNSEAPQAALIERHSELGEQLLYIMAAYAVVAVAAAVLLGRTRTTAPDQGPSNRQPVAIGLSVLLVAGAVAAGIWTYRVGDLGSRAVWDPTDSVDFSDPGEQ